MQYKALVSFSGTISMSSGEVREISNPAIIDDLIKADYIIPLAEDAKPKKKRKGKKDES